MAAVPEDENLTRRMIKLGIREEDLEETFVRGTGSGGQKINKTSSTVVLRHLPTGLEVRCQRERSQTMNDELYYDEAATSWTLIPWEPADGDERGQGDGDEVEVELPEEIEAKLDRSKTYACNAERDGSGWKVLEVGDVIAE